jgi:hypothetical protein
MLQEDTDSWRKRRFVGGAGVCDRKKVCHEEAVPGESGSLKWIPFNHGRGYRVYNEKADCTFYDLDCGYGFRENNPEARLACMRLEDEKIFYIENG